jgi:hypothetical protein
LENKYNTKYRNVSTSEYEMPNLRNCIKRGLFLLADVYNIKNVTESKTISFSHSNLVTMKAISRKLNEQKMTLLGSFKKSFQERCAQDLIRRESSNIESAVVHINEILIADFKSKFDDWLTSQPYRKLASLKYTYSNFNEFFREIEMIFAIMCMPFPKKDYVYLKGLEFQFEKLHELAWSIENNISTRWEWGHGLILSQSDYSNSAMSLSSPINFGFNSLKTTVEVPSVGSFNFNSTLLLIGVLILKIKKLIWNH